GAGSEAVTDLAAECARRLKELLRHAEAGDQRSDVADVHLVRQIAAPQRELGALAVELVGEARMEQVVTRLARRGGLSGSTKSVVSARMHFFSSVNRTPPVRLNESKTSNVDWPLSAQFQLAISRTFSVREFSSPGKMSSAVASRPSSHKPMAPVTKESR